MTHESIAAIAVLPSARAGQAPSLARLYLLELWYELLKMLRQPSYSVPTIGFPVMFYLLFGVLLGGRAPRGLNLAEYLIATYGAFGVVGASMFGLGVGLAAEKAQGWLLLKRVSPMPPAAMLVAKVTVSAIFGLIIITLMGLCGLLAGGVHLTAGTWLRLSTVLVLGAIPFCLVGLALGALLSPASAPGVINLVHLPLGFLSGLAMPIEVMPAAARSLAVLLPQYHLGQLALAAIGRGSEAAIATHIAVLAGTAILAALAAVWAYRRVE